MTYPQNYPSGQYPQAPGGGYPAYPGGVDPMQAPPPSGGTAITTAILAILGGLVQGFEGAAGLFGGASLAGDSSGMAHSAPVLLIIIGGVTFVAGILLLVGAIMMFVRKPVGRMLVIIGCGLTIATVLGTIAWTVIGLGGSPSMFLLLTGTVFPILTLVLAILGSTKRYLAAPRQPQYAGVPGMAQPGMGQPGMPGVSPAGMPQPGLPPAGYPQPTTPPPGMPQPGYPQPTTPPPGLPQAGYPQPAQPGYPQPPQQPGYPQPPGYPPQA